jgi:hypothetical protein
MSDDRTKSERLHDLEREIEQERQQPIYSEEEKRHLMEAIRQIDRVKKRALEE